MNEMKNVDHHEVQINKQFMMFRKAANEKDQTAIANSLAQLYEQHEQYSDAITELIYKSLGDSDRDSKRVGLMVLNAVKHKTQGVARSTFVKTFHEPVFRLFEGNTDESLLGPLENAYLAILEIGGNRDDKRIGSNVKTSLEILSSKNAKEVRKISAYSILRLVIVTSPYVTFKRLLEKAKDSPQDNLTIVVDSGCHKSLRVRQAYMRFIEEYVKYIAEKKDTTFQKMTFKRLFGLTNSQSQNSQQSMHIRLETTRILLKHMSGMISSRYTAKMVEFPLQRLRNNRNGNIQKGLIELLPFLLRLRVDSSVTTLFLRYLLGIKGEDERSAQEALSAILLNMQLSSPDHLEVIKDILKVAGLNLRAALKIDTFYQLGFAEVKTVEIILCKLKPNQLSAIISKDSLYELASQAILISLDSQTIKLLTNIAQNDFYNIGVLLETKLIHTISKILTGTTKINPSEGKEIEVFIESLDRNRNMQNESSKVRAIEALSRYPFRREFVGKISEFVEDRVMKYYLEWGNQPMRVASVGAAFLLSSIEMLDKVLRVGLTDRETTVREKVFRTLYANIQQREELHRQFINLPLLLQLFQAIEDRNETIRLTALKTLCFLDGKNTSPLIAPFLKKILARCLSHLGSNFKYFPDKNWLIHTISILIEFNSAIVSAHTSTLLRLLLKYLADRNGYEGLELVFFDIFRALTVSLPECLLPYARQICAHLLQAMEDKLNFEKRSIAMKIFVSIIQRCKYVVVPYLELPYLEGTLSYLLTSEIEQHSKMDLMRIIGGLGFIDRLSVIRRLTGDQTTPLKILFDQYEIHSNFLRLQHDRKVEYRDTLLQQELKAYSDELHLFTGTRPPLLPRDSHPIGTPPPSSATQKIEGTEITGSSLNLSVLRHIFELLEDNSLTEKHRYCEKVLEKVLVVMSEDDLKGIMGPLLRLIQKREELLGLLLIMGECEEMEEWLQRMMDIALGGRELRLGLSVVRVLTSRKSQHLRGCMQTLTHRLHQIVENYWSERDLMLEVMVIYQNISYLLQPYIDTILPQLLAQFCHSHSELGHTVLDFIINLALISTYLLHFVSLITHTFILLLNKCDSKHLACKPCLRNKICLCVAILVVVYRRQFLAYLPAIHEAILHGEDVPPLYAKAIRNIQRIHPDSMEEIFTEDELEIMKPKFRGYSLNHLRIVADKEQISIEVLNDLVEQFDLSKENLREEDWQEWLKKTSILLLRKSSNPILKACADLAEEYAEFGLQMFSLAFGSHWDHFNNDQRRDFLENMKRILECNPRPVLIVRKTILNLMEFLSRRIMMSRTSDDLLEPYCGLLAESSAQISSFAKELYYRELQFENRSQKSGEQSQMVQNLMGIYMNLCEPENATGLFKIAAQARIPCETSWYMRTHRYEEAYLAYKVQPKQMANNLECLSHIDEERFIWEFQRNIGKLQEAQKEKIALLALEAYGNLSKWQKVEQTVMSIPTDSAEKSLWAAIIAVKQAHYPKAVKHIHQTRKLSYQKIPALINILASNESLIEFTRLQQTFQLQEIMEVNHKSELQGVCSAWSDRLIGCPRNSQIWGRLAIVRKLLISTAQNFEFYYEYCEILLKEKQVTKCKSLLARMKNELQEIRELRLLQLLEIKIGFMEASERQIEPILAFLDENAKYDPPRVGQMYFKCAESLSEQGIQDQRVIKLYEKSAQLSNTKKIWYVLSLMQLQASKAMEKPGEEINKALQSVLKSIMCGKKKNEYFLQGYLKIISILSEYGEIPGVYATFEDNYKLLPVEGWINIVPQMIAQLYQSPSKPAFLHAVQSVCKYVGTHHPQSILFSLNFAVKSNIPERVHPAENILEYIQEKHPCLAQEAEIISSQLGKAAIKLKELWFDSIDSTWSVYSQNKDGAQLVQILKQLCRESLSRNSSNSECAFNQEFGKEIEYGYRWLLRYDENQQENCILQAFQIFYQIFKKLQESLESLKKIYLKNVAPKLMRSRSYTSCIPGLYVPGRDCVRIASFNNQLPVLPSKQRPRKLTIYGTDGKAYNFLLKGKEDLRLDQRVMQFLGLVNRLLRPAHQTLKKDLEIIRYSIIPLTRNTGLIGWVQQSDTFTELIREYRASRNIRHYAEKELYEKMCPDYLSLPMINKLEIFKSGLQASKGKDLQDILWIKSKNSQAWFERRNNFTTSLATMSMVGYILGLGDRHLSNIMLERQSGKILHIDFGDCFEVAMLRERFPERVPFRLTRILQKAMGAAGIYGLFKSTCEIVMETLREHKESLFGVLETFAHDPIISWQITTEKEIKKQDSDPFPEKKVVDDDLLSSLLSKFETNSKEKESDSRRKAYEHIKGFEQLRNGLLGAEKAMINEKAVKALVRIRRKLKGNEFSESVLTVQEQVNKLIQLATSHQNICQSWMGWCPFW